MKIRCMIVDDEPLALDVLETFIGRLDNLELVCRCHNAVEEVEGLLRYSAQNRRFEFVQVDKAGSITLLMHGKWNPDFNMIVFTPAIAPKHVSSQVTWQYLFFDDGSFRKVVRTPDGKGSTMIAAEFHCQQPSVAKRKH